jgi:predicted HAD superfamily Cof-like phosphohydrolase
LDGAYLAFGMGHLKQKAFEEVHRSNMSKLGEDGKPIKRIPDGKILKGPNYFPPDLKKVLYV